MPGQRRDGAAGAQVIVISGPSGVGKDTIINELRRRPIGQTFHYVVTCTTREPRSGEMNGVHYHFHTDETFTALREASGLLESATVHGR